MVDELGGIEKAIAEAASKANLKEGEYEVKILPGTRTLADLIRGNVPEAKMPFRPEMKIGETNLLSVLSPSAGRLVKQQIQFIQLLQQRPVVLVSPFVITIK